MPARCRVTTRSGQTGRLLVSRGMGNSLVSMCASDNVELRYTVARISYLIHCYVGHANVSHLSHQLVIYVLPFNMITC